MKNKNHILLCRKKEQMKIKKITKCDQSFNKPSEQGSSFQVTVLKSVNHQKVDYKTLIHTVQADLYKICDLQSNQIFIEKLFQIHKR